MVLNWTRPLSMVDLLADIKLDQAALDGLSAGLSASGGLKLDQAALDG